MLTSVAEIANRRAWIDRYSVPGSDAVKVDDLVGMPVAIRIEQEQAHACHPFQPVHAVAIERDMECVRIALHAGGFAARPGPEGARRPACYCPCQSADHLTQGSNISLCQWLRPRAGAPRQVLHRPSASIVAVLMLKPASFAARASTR